MCSTYLDKSVKLQSTKDCPKFKAIMAEVKFRRYLKATKQIGA